MLYEIRLTSTYKYGGTVSDGRHILRLTPSDLPQCQRVLTAALTIDPRPRDLEDSVDFFGNRMTSVTVPQAHDTIAFRLIAKVERFLPKIGADLSPRLKDLAEELAAQHSLAALAPHHFVTPSVRLHPLPEIQDYAARFRRPQSSVFDLAQQITRAIYDDMTYDPDSTDADTPLAQAFASKRGVCQDYAHIMIATLRSLGIPAGYVSGYLRTEPPPGQARLEGADAMHAWVSVWCGVAMGWVDFDPTNNLVVENDHITVARGRDYADVSPIRGILRFSGSQINQQAVDVIPLD